jgi:hypothetical protein
MSLAVARVSDGGSYLKVVSLDLYRIFRKRDSEVTRQFLEAALSTLSNATLKFPQSLRYGFNCFCR